MNFKKLAKWLGVCATVCATSGVMAADYPSRPITIIVPFAAGGGSDITARLVGQHLSDRLDVPVIVENRAGANSQIGTMAVVQSKPDGYTMLMGTTSLINNPLLYSNLPYNAERDLRPVAGVVDVPAFLVVNSEVEAKDAVELFDMARQRKEGLNYGSAGAGSTLHLAAEHLKAAEGFDALHIPYKGSGQAVVGLAAGEVDFNMENYGPALPHLKSERVRVLGIAASERFPGLPDVPTLGEQGLDGTDLSSWFGLFVNADTPDDIVDLLNENVNAVMAIPDVQKRLVDLGLMPLTSGSAEDMAQRMKDDVEKWSTVIRTANVTVE